MQVDKSLETKQRKVFNYMKIKNLEKSVGWIMSITAAVIAMYNLSLHSIISLQ
jgi:hypothetical protein